MLIKSLFSEDGDGYLATIPDLPGCISDGETREMAACNVGDAVAPWIKEAQILGRRDPHAFPALGYGPKLNPVSTLML